ncbi:MAG: SUMF1/EgtB/PvdO family nonheme iron enzyme [Bacteroidales bacterium]|nr:SUMF1/EgtB/PvdO family nonheme iron enzyme [Bacteroidales bacterium]MBP5679630.1 SUMF1/EgtB/PvdO family nonheme iron enzyme [Bacteroidales bacterium]
MKKYAFIAGAIAFLALSITVTSCDDAAEGIQYTETPFPVGTAVWRNDVSSEDRAVITNLINNMVKVDACKFYMGVQAKSSKRDNYFVSANFSRDTVWLQESTQKAYHLPAAVYYNDTTYVEKSQSQWADPAVPEYSMVVTRKSRIDTAWFAPGSFNFVDTLKLKRDTLRYATIYRYNAYWVGPVVTVTMPDYYIGKFEITQREWEAVMHRKPTGNFYLNAQNPIPDSKKSAWYDEFGKGDNIAAYNIWYEDAVAFCDTLSKLTGLRFRLPTEAEWECAARGGKYSHGYKYPGSDEYAECGWVRSNSFNEGMGGKHYGVHAGGEKLPNELGIYDMVGNVSEWVSNCYYRYSMLDANNPQGVQPLNNGQDTLIMRGGSWMQSNSIYYCPSVRKWSVWSTYETEESKQSAFVNCGFRIAL